MKIAITWATDDPNDPDGDLIEHKLEGKTEFKNSLEFSLPVIQSVVDKFESEGITIDQGGNDEWYEFSLPDESAHNPHTAARLLAELENKLRS